MDDIKEIFPNITNNEFKFFIRFLLKNDIYNSFVKGLYDLELKYKERKIPFRLNSLCFDLLLLVNYGNITENHHKTWRRLYKKKFEKEIIKEWDNTVLEILEKYNLDIDEYYSARHYTLYIPLKLTEKIQRLLEKNKMLRNRIAYSRYHSLNGEYLGNGARLNLSNAFDFDINPYDWDDDNDAIL